MCLFRGFCGDKRSQNCREEVEGAAVPHSRGCDGDFLYIHTHAHVHARTHTYLPGRTVVTVEVHRCGIQGL